MLPDRLVSIHFPKSGGTSLGAQLAAALGGDLELEYAHDPLTDAGAGRAPFPAGKRAVHGHFRALRYAETTAFWLTFLREPVQNLVSIYVFWSGIGPHGNPMHDRFLAERPSLLDFAAYPAFATLMSEQYFGAFDMRRFDFIGFHDTRAADLPQLAERLGVPLDPGLHENRAADEGRSAASLITSRKLSMLRDRLRVDIAFYERARRLRAAG